MRVGVSTSDQQMHVQREELSITKDFVRWFLTKRTVDGICIGGFVIAHGQYLKVNSRCYRFPSDSDARSRNKTTLEEERVSS